MTTVTKFFGFGAFVGAIRGLRQVEWWPKDPATLTPAWDQNALIATDLAKTPLGVVQGLITIAQLEVDDHLMNGGLTRIGPRYPQGEMIGPIWLAETFYNSIPQGKRPPRHQTTEGSDYELTSLLHWNGNVPVRRFFGFRGKLNAINGTKFKLDVWHGGRGKIPGEVGKPVEVDTANIDTTTSISNVGDDGAIYIEDSTARSLQLMSPKRPEASGGDFY
jgi:hypothetical protein